MRALRYRVILLAFFCLWGCSKANDNSTILDASGKHPANWIVNHREAFRTLAGAIDDPAVAAKSRCVECHGTDLSGGNVKVGCFSQGFGGLSCHFHPAGYRSGDRHGADAKTFGASLGLRSCQGCHGSQYLGGLLSKVSCSSPSSPADPAFACHGVGAPHAGNWATSTTRLHSNTDPNNAEACAQCHSGGRLLTLLPPPPPQAAGTAPGCFNNTLCHSGLHPAGWIDPAQHGTIAKSAPGSDKGFASCQVCHGTDFKGSASKVSCFSASRANGACHVRNGASVNAPHSPLPWRGASPSLTHTSTVDDAQGVNAGVCAQCHLNGANLRTQIITSFASGTPGCFNSTLCHGAVGHPVGWADPAQHGTTAKANLTFCQTCHADKPGGGPGSNPRFNVVIGRLTTGCEACHQANTAHPPVLQIPAVFGITSPDPLGSPWFRHRTSTNFDACNRCHGANLEGGVGPRCQDCHVAALPTATKDSPDPCRSCHSQPPSGTTYPNINRAHGSHATVNVPTGGLCAECHSGLGSGTLDHFLRVKNIRLGTIVPASQTRAQAGAVVFGGVLSKANGAAPVFSLATLQCTNTYCHGSTLEGFDLDPNVIRTPAWGTPFQGIHCDKCHGYPPITAGHGSIPGPTQCINCHPHVNASGTGFTDPTKHINGTIDVSAGASHLVPYDTHKADVVAAGGNSVCLACHAMGTAASVYPAAVAGNPPDCRGCHRKAAPLHTGTAAGANCSSCHGSGTAAGAAIGRPSTNNGTFPDNRNSHNVNIHTNAACTVCHVLGASGGSGSGANHGRGSIAGPVRDGKPGVVSPFTAGIVVTGGSKGVAPSVTCNHNATLGGGCGNGNGNQTW